MIRSLAKAEEDLLEQSQPSLTKDVIAQKFQYLSFYIIPTIIVVNWKANKYWKNQP